MRSKIEMRYTLDRMRCILYSLELMDWDAYHDAYLTWYAAWGACDAYFKRLNEDRNES